MNNNAVILAYDPGTVKMGQAILEFDLTTLSIVKLHYELIKIDKLPVDPHTAFMYGDLYARSRAAAKHVKQTLAWLKPLCVVYESNYMNMATPSAFGALVALESMVKIEVESFDAQLPFYLIQPNVIKKAIGAKGNANKAGVFDAFCECREILDHLHHRPQDIDHNVIDAICVAYCRLVQYRTDP